LVGGHRRAYRTYVGVLKRWVQHGDQQSKSLVDHGFNQLNDEYTDGVFGRGDFKRDGDAQFRLVFDDDDAHCHLDFNALYDDRFFRHFQIDGSDFKLLQYFHELFGHVASLRLPVQLDGNQQHHWQ
jgi:hypothetical protein